MTNRIKDKPTCTLTVHTRSHSTYTHTNVHIHITKLSRSHFPLQYPAYNDKMPHHSSDSTSNNIPSFNPFVYVIENGGWISMENSINWNYLQNRTYWNHLPFILFQSTGCGSPHNELWKPPVAFIVSSKSLSTHGGSSCWFSIYIYIYFFVFRNIFNGMSVASDLGNFKWAASEPSEQTIWTTWAERSLADPRACRAREPEPTTSFRGPRGEENVGNGHGA